MAPKHPPPPAPYVKDPAPAQGLLPKALKKDGATNPALWVEIPVKNILVQVASDAISMPFKDRDAVRMPVSYAETVSICFDNGWVPPTKAICDAMYKAAKVKLVAVTLDANKEMASVGHTLTFHDRVQQILDDKKYDDGDLIFGAWKLWILDPMLKGKNGAVNYGFWTDKGTVIQTPGSRHDNKHADYSQLLQPCLRWAKDAKTKASVDLLTWIQEDIKLEKAHVDVLNNPKDLGF
jgi:hypothetical protein